MFHFARVMIALIPLLYLPLLIQTSPRHLMLKINSSCWILVKNNSRHTVVALLPDELHYIEYSTGKIQENQFLD